MWRSGGNECIYYIKPKLCTHYTIHTLLFPDPNFKRAEVGKQLRTSPTIVTRNRKIRISQKLNSFYHTNNMMITNELYKYFGKSNKSHIHTTRLTDWPCWHIRSWYLLRCETDPLIVSLSAGPGKVSTDRRIYVSEILIICMQTPLTSHAVDCGNGHIFCWECLGDAHEPASCDNWKLWHQKIGKVRPEECTRK